MFWFIDFQFILKIYFADTKIGDKALNKLNDENTPPPKSPPNNDNILQPQKFPTVDDIDDSDIHLNLVVENKLPEEPIIDNVGSSFLLNIVNDVENEFWKYPPSEYKPGILIRSLNHLYENVYGSELKACI